MSKSTSSPAIQLNIKADGYYAGHDDLGLTNESSAVPSLGGIPLKYISLVTLAVQNSMLAIIMHYSRISTPPSQMYSAATAVLLNELLKGFISLVIAFLRVPQIHNHEASFTLSSFVIRTRFLTKDIFSPDCWKLSIPAILYVIQNNLQYVAASNLDAATFQVTYQMKILTTAAFSVMLLRKKLAPYQWLALFCLAIGVGIVQIQTGTASHSNSPSASMAAMNPLEGFLAVSAACFTSGLAGVYFEMVLKNSQTDLWVRNVQLSLFSILPALAPILFSYRASLSHSPAGWLDALFQNFGFWAWATVLTQVLGGLLTALVIKYSDNILKGFATSLSIVISFLASIVLFDFQITFTFILGSVVVLTATWLYNQQPKRIPNDLLTWRFWRETEKPRTPMGVFPRIPSATSGYTAMSSSRSSSSLSLSSVSSSDTEDSKHYTYLR